MIAHVVDDDPDNRDLISEALRLRGWIVESDEDSLAAFTRMRQIRPDLLVLDVCMPRLDGLSFLALLRSSRAGRQIRVILSTSLELEPHEVNGADLLLRKPFTETALERAVGRLFPASLAGAESG
jgi:CheY-like chemotaxis protein